MSKAAGHTHSSSARICWIWLTGLGDQLLAAGPQVPQPTPGLVDRLRDVAAQLRGQPGDQHRVLVVGLVERQVLAAPRPRRLHRLHTHERHPTLRRQLANNPPPVPGRLARHRHPGPTLRRGPVGGPVQRPPQVPRAAGECPPRQHLRVVVGDDDHLLLVGQVDPHDRVLDRDELAQPRQSSVAVAVASRHAASVAHERPPPAMGHQALQAHQEDVPTPRTDTQNVFLCRHPSTGSASLGSSATSRGSRRATSDRT